MRGSAGTQTYILCSHGPRISSAPRRECGALRSIRGMNSHRAQHITLAELLNHGRPQTPNLGTALKGSLNHHKLRGWIDTDALAEVADKRELAPRSGEQPQ